ncbi:MAG: cytidine deaminase [Candidatus Bathyarchaeia archaeon]|jgi:cytidine deaminase
MTALKIGKTEKKLLEASLTALNSAYVLWGFKVGAAVLAEDGQVYEGCNVESWVSGLGTCAERCAINHAVLNGNRKIKELAVVMNANSGGEPRPCGACLQYISDFSVNPQIKVVMAKAEKGKILKETVNIRKLEELLPFPYRK